VNWLDRVRAGLREHEDARDEVVAGETSAGDAPAEPTSTPSAPPKLDELPGTIGPHRVVGVLGRGGVGVVYVARSERLDRLVAVKVLRVDRGRAPELVERFDIEARAAARLRHPNIVGIHEVGEDAGRQYLVMELIPGRSLAARLRDDGRLPPREAARVAERLARALAYAHARAILHRDLKPANVLLPDTGEPMLTDFGMAKFFGQGQDEVKSPTVSGQVMGTPAYMPPEQARGEHGRVDRRSDVYSLGATLYEMLTARPPWDGLSVMAILAQVTSLEPVTPPSRWAPDLDADLETICLKALEKEPGDRYLTADALADDLARWLADEPIVARRPSLGARCKKWLRRNRALARALVVAIGCALVVLVVGTVGFVERLGEERDRADAAAAEAARQAERARARAAVAQDALRVLIDEVGDELADVPGERVRRVRGELLEHARGALERLRDAGIADGSLLQAAEAQRQLGELLLARDGRAPAVAALERALALSREAVRLAPGEPEARVDLCLSLVLLSDALSPLEPERPRARALLAEAAETQGALAPLGSFEVGAPGERRARVERARAIVSEHLERALRNPDLSPPP
jgi:predicted Ser/Thr protein kinase